MGSWGAAIVAGSDAISGDEGPGGELRPQFAVHRTFVTTTVSASMNGPGTLQALAAEMVADGQSFDEAGGDGFYDFFEAEYTCSGWETDFPTSATPYAADDTYVLATVV